MNVSGQLKVLTDDQMEEVHSRACDLLEKKGMIFESQYSLDVFKSHGCKVEGNTVYIGRELVDKCLAQAPSTFTLEGGNPDYNVTIGDGIAIHPAGGEVFVRDFDGTLRSSTLKDFAEIQTIYQACDNINIGGFQPFSPSDIDSRFRGLYCQLESFRHCNKPTLSPMELETIQKKEEILRLYEIYFGKEGYLDDHYVTWHAVCPNSPYIYSDFACEGIQVYAEANQPVIIVSAPMSGITSPVFLLSTVVMSLAEELAGLVLAQLIKPGVPVVLSASLTYGYMKSATWECASPDTSLMLAANVQMYRHYYHLPARAQTGVTSSKTIDYQAGMETMQSFLYTALAGVNLTSQTSGSLANLLTSSLEKAVLDDELIGRVRWLVDGMTVDEEQWGEDDLMNADPGQDFLLEDTTLEHLRDFFVPSVSNWDTIEEWEREGSEDVVESAHRRVREILEQAPETLLDEQQEKDMLDYIASVEQAG